MTFKKLFSTGRVGCWRNPEWALGLLLFVLFGFSTSAQADIRLPKLFSDSMVLQRQAETPIWGLADPGEELVFTFSGNGIDKKELKTICDENGNFQFKLPSPPVGGPYEMEIVGKSSTFRVRDVMVGDVWLCSGQSNMEMTIAASDSVTEVAQAKPNPQLRLLNIDRIASPRALDEFTGGITWSVSTPEHAANFSAVGYHFGQQLQATQNVPIGIINASWGGTLCEAWISQSSLKNNQALSELYQFGQSSQEGIQKQDQHNALFNGMISPLGRFSIKGVVWYQGESNVGRGAQYGTLFPTLIKDWRQFFQQPEMPFLFVQLAPFRYENQSPNALAELWDAQLHTVLNVPNTGMAVTTDLGNFSDIHPANKKTVASRLADWAIAEVYNDKSLIAYPKTEPDAIDSGSQEEKVTEPKSSETDSSKNLGAESPKSENSGDTVLGDTVSGSAGTQIDANDSEETLQLKVYASPLLKSFSIDGSKVVVNFYASQGLKSSDGKPLREFTIAGEDQVFYPADAKVVGETVEVTSAEVSKPVAVRFAFRDTPEPNLVNERDYPASPFRTDAFPLLSAGKNY